MTQTLALFGATGATGKHVLTKALAKGMKVRALVRTPSKVTETNTNLTVVQGDFADETAIKETVKGADYVICTAGGNISQKGYDSSMMTKFVKLLYKALEGSNVKVFLYQGGAFTPAPGQSLPCGKVMLKYTLGYMIGLLPMIKDNNSVMDFIVEQKKSVPFKAIFTRPGLIKEEEEETKPLHGSEEAGSFSEGITFAGLAAFSLAALKDESLYGTYPFVRI